MDRLRLDSKLREISEHVYFQPKSNVEMEYPAIVYEAARMDTRFAANNPYKITERFTVTSISRDPDDPAPRQIASLPMSSHSTFFVRENLNHHVFDVFV